MADTIDLTSPSVGLDTPTQIDPWDAIRKGLIEELDADPALFHSVLQRSISDLGADNINRITNATEYFATLENNLQENIPVLDYMICLVDAIQLHSHQGTRPVRDVLLSYKKQLIQYRKERARLSLARDQNFIGRTKDLVWVKNTLEGDTPGIAICGLGGMGKTSLAYEICYIFAHSSQRWQIKTIDMREKEDLVDLLRELLAALDQPCNSADIDDLVNQFFQSISSVQTRMIFFMDNLDDLMRNEKLKTSLLRFLFEFCRILKNSQVPVRMLITARQKLIPASEVYSKLSRQISKVEGRLEDLVKELELKHLNQQDAVELLKTCIKRPLEPFPDNEVCQKIVRLCGGSPLGITTVGATIRNGLVHAELLAKNLEKNVPGLHDEVSRCLEQTFRCLEIDKQEILVKLSVFRTSKFDLNAASIVLEEQMDIKSPIVFLTRVNLLYLKSRHLIEIDDLYVASEEDIDPYSKHVKFSVHPLVDKYMEKVVKEASFTKTIDDARRKFTEFIEYKTHAIIEEFDKDCVKAWRTFKDYKVHIRNYHQIILDSVVGGNHVEPRDMLTCKRISEIADFFVEDYLKFKLLNKFISDSKARGHLLECAIWQIQLARKFFDVDRNEIAARILHNIASETLSSIFETLCDKDSIVQVLGSFLYLRGRVNLKDGKTEDAIEHLIETKRFFRKISNSYIRNQYRCTDLAWVNNTLGKAYGCLTPPDLARAREFHLEAFRLVASTSRNFNNIDIPVYLTNVGICSYKQGLVEESNGNRIGAKEKYCEAENFFSYCRKLNAQFKMEKFYGHAELLKYHALVETKTGMIDLAVKDAEEAYELMNCLLSPPNDTLTATLHHKADVMIAKVIKSYKSYKAGLGGDIFDTINLACEIIAEYDHVMHLMKLGGLSRDHEDYQAIKDNYMWLLIQTKDTKKTPKVKEFFRNFENGKYEAIRKKRRGKKETTRFTYVYDELQALFRAGAFEGATMTEANSSDDDYSEDEDDDCSDVNSPPPDRNIPIIEPVFNLRPTKLNFNEVFRTFKNKNGECEYDDVDDDDYFIEEGLDDIEVSVFDIEPSLISESKAGNMEVDDDNDGDNRSENNAIKLCDVTAPMLMRSISRRASNISISSQSSIEDDVFIEEKRKRFRKRGSRDGSVQEFLEVLSEEAQSRRSRMKSTSSTSFELSKEEEIFSSGKSDVTNIRFKYENLVKEMDKGQEEDTAINRKRKHLRQMGTLHPTINEENADVTDTKKQQRNN